MARTQGTAGRALDGEKGKYIVQWPKTGAYGHSLTTTRSGCRLDAYIVPVLGC